jgi:hypothetical protein
LAQAAWRCDNTGFPHQTGARAAAVAGASAGSRAVAADRLFQKRLKSVGWLYNCAF